LVLNQGLRDLFSQASANSRSPNAIARVFNLSYDAIWNDQEKVWNGSLSFQQVYPLILKRAAAADLAPVEHKRPQEVAILAQSRPYVERDVRFNNPVGHISLPGLCLSKISKCLSGWGLFLLHNSR
jgi:hypothetical protein